MKHIKQIYYTLTNKCPTSFRRIKNTPAFENIKDIFNKYLELVNKNLLDQISSPIHIRKGETTPFSREMSRVLTTYICSATFDLSERKLAGPLFETKFDFEWINHHPHFIVEKHTGFGTVFTYPYSLISNAYLKFLELVNSDETCNTVVLYFKDKKLEKNIFTYAKEIKMSTNETTQSEVNNIFTPEQKAYIDNINVMTSSKLNAFQNAIQTLTHELERKSREFEESILALQQNYHQDINAVKQSISNLTHEWVMSKPSHVKTNSELPNDLGNTHMSFKNMSSTHPLMGIPPHWAEQDKLLTKHILEKSHLNHNQFNSVQNENYNILIVLNNLAYVINDEISDMIVSRTKFNQEISDFNNTDNKSLLLSERLGALHECILKLYGSDFLNELAYTNGNNIIRNQEQINPAIYPQINPKSNNDCYRAQHGYRF